MPFNDLREFLVRLDEIGQLAHVKNPVAAQFELSAYCRRMLERRGPALIFENVADHDVPVVTDVFATRARFAAALETTESVLARTWVERTQRLVPPVRYDGSAPCQEVVMTGEQVDLTTLPVPTWNEFDGGPYISMGVVLSRHPVTQARNAAIYRIQVFDKDTLGMLFAPYRHIALHMRDDPAARFPVAIAIGVDPVCAIAAATPLPYGLDELALAGALRGAPLELTPCKTVPLEVPATAEIVIEGEILADEMRVEGPYGEFTGYYGEAALRPVIKVTAITTRANPIFLGSYQGKPPQDSTLMQSIPGECEILRTVALTGIRDVYMTEAGCGAFNAVVSVDKQCEGYGRMVGSAVIGTWAGRFIKNLIVVPGGVDPRDDAEVQRAVALNVQPHRDVDILHNVTGVALDPSLPPDERRTRFARTSKMIIDATGFKYEDQPVPVLCMPPQQMLDAVDRKWKDELAAYQ